MIPIYKNSGQTKYGFLTGSMLKWIAVISMVIDHFAAVVIKGCVNAGIFSLSQEQLSWWNTVYKCMRHIGRTAFPLFAFFLVEGFYYTKSRKKYGIRLLLFAFLSEVPYDLAIYGRLWDFTGQNVLFSFALGLAVLAAADGVGGYTFWKKKGKGGLPGWAALMLQIFIFAAGGALAYVCRLDYTYKGIALLAVFYFFHFYRVSAAIAGFCVFSWNPYSLPAFLLLPFYNGRRGRGKKWCYLFYPGHLLFLYGVQRLIICLYKMQ